MNDKNLIPCKEPHDVIVMDGLDYIRDEVMRSMVRKQLQDAREVIKWYADKSNYQPRCESLGMQSVGQNITDPAKICIDAMEDKGQRARDYLDKWGEQ